MIELNQGEDNQNKQAVRRRGRTGDTNTKTWQMSGKNQEERGIDTNQSVVRMQTLAA